AASKSTVARGFGMLEFQTSRAIACKPRMRSMAAKRCLLLALLACHGKSDPPAATPPGPQPSPELAPEPVAQPVFPDGTRSLELRRTVGVRLEPGEDAKRIGNIAIDTRVAWHRTAPGKGCERPWIEIEPRGWVCGDYVVPSKKPPYGQE